RWDGGSKFVYDTEKVFPACYRPFSERYLGFFNSLISVMFSMDEFVEVRPGRSKIECICFHGKSAEQPFAALAAIAPFDICYLKTGNGSTFGAGLYRYSATGERIENITDWALNKFRKRYGKSVTKDDIFHYCYAVLHDPVYRETYAINLKREFPRIPFYPDFKQWVAWGERLMTLHINYEDVEPWPLARVDEPKKRAEGSAPKAVLRSDHATGNIRLDTDTQLTGVPEEVWRYRLGNRTAIDWVLDQHKEKTPRDSTIREKFNTYRFADYKEKVIDLLRRVTRVSVETVAITEAMDGLNRDGWDAGGER
ncbi:MAG: type ISP restriction/modification enzyme, partial [Nitratireductor sp.]